MRDQAEDREQRLEKLLCSAGYGGVGGPGPQASGGLQVGGFPSPINKSGSFRFPWRVKAHAQQGPLDHLDPWTVAKYETGYEHMILCVPQM